jgi:hypothetical protein
MFVMPPDDEDDEAILSSQRVSDADSGARDSTLIQEDRVTTSITRMCNLEKREASLTQKHVMYVSMTSTSNGMD